MHQTPHWPSIYFFYYNIYDHFLIKEKYGETTVTTYMVRPVSIVSIRGLDSITLPT